MANGHMETFRVQQKYLQRYHSVIRSSGLIQSGLSVEICLKQIESRHEDSNTSQTFHQSIIGFFCMEMHFEKKIVLVGKHRKCRLLFENIYMHILTLTKM